MNMKYCFIYNQSLLEELISAGKACHKVVKENEIEFNVYWAPVKGTVIFTCADVL